MTDCLPPKVQKTSVIIVCQQIHSIPDIWSTLGPPKNWPCTRNSGQILDIWSISVYSGKSGPPKNWPNNRKDHISDDHITGTECRSNGILPPIGWPNKRGQRLHERNRAHGTFDLFWTAEYIPLRILVKNAPTRLLAPGWHAHTCCGMAVWHLCNCRWSREGGGKVKTASAGASRQQGPDLIDLRRPLEGLIL